MRSHVPLVPFTQRSSSAFSRQRRSADPGGAIAAGAEILVTGDKELLDLGDIEDLEILSPRQFWEKLRAQQRRAGRGKLRRSR